MESLNELETRAHASHGSQGLRRCVHQREMEPPEYCAVTYHVRRAFGRASHRDLSLDLFQIAGTGG